MSEIFGDNDAYAKKQFCLILKKYEELRSIFSDETMLSLSETIIQRHYKSIALNKYYFKNNEKLRSDDGVIMISGGELIGFSSYLLMLNKPHMIRANYFKSGKSKDERFNYGVEMMKQGQRYMNHGEITPFFLNAKSRFMEASKSLNTLEDKKYDFVKNIVLQKLHILNGINIYTKKLHEEKVLLNIAKQ